MTARTVPAAQRLAEALPRRKWYWLSVLAALIGSLMFLAAYRELDAQYPLLASICMLLILPGGFGPMLLAGWGALAISVGVHLQVDAVPDVSDRVRFMGTFVLMPVLAWVGELRRRHRIEALQREVQLGEANESLRLANEQLAASVHELRSRSEQLEALTTASPGVMFQYAAWEDGRHGFEFISRNIRDEASLEREALLKDPTPFWQLIVKDDRAAVRLQMHRSREQLTPWLQEFRVTDARSGRSGTRWVSLHAVPHAYPELGKIMWTGLIADATERRTLEEEFRQAQRLESIGVLAGGVAHDFNNLLTAVIGEVELMQLSRSMPGDMQKSLSHIKHAALSGAALSRQLLGFAGRSMSAPRVLAVSELLERVAPLMRRLLREQIRLEIEAPADAGWIHVDPTQFDQVMMNLTTNARDAMTQGGALTVRVRRLAVNEARPVAYTSLAPGELIELAVSDTGPGMPEDVRTRAFEPFFTTKPIGQGSGLGLATSHGIVTQSGGTMTIDPFDGHGCTVRVAFPLWAAPPQGTETGNVDVALTGTETLLIVDDDHQVRRVTVETLRRRGYHVLEAASGADALRLAATVGVPIDLLVTDVVMPEMDGMQLADRLRTQGLIQRVLFVSGYPADTMQGHGICVGQVDLIAKPYRVDDLARRVRRQLDAPVGVTGA